MSGNGVTSNAGWDAMTASMAAFVSVRDAPPSRPERVVGPGGGTARVAQRVGLGGDRVGLVVVEETPGGPVARAVGFGPAPAA